MFHQKQIHFDVITVYIDQEKRLSRVNMLENVIL